MIANDIFFIPDRECKASDPRPHLQFVGLQDGQTITQTSLDINIVANATAGFHSWRLDWSTSPNPGNWNKLVGDINIPVQAPSKVYTWDLTGILNGQIILRLYMQGDGSDYADQNIHLNLLLPTLTPTPPPTSTPTSTRTSTPTSTSTPIPTVTPTPIPSETPTDTPVPTETPTPEAITTQ